MNALEPLVGAVRSCTAVSESFDAFNRLAAALAKSQDRRASLGVFAFGADRQGALANGPAWAAPEEHRHLFTPRLAVRPVSEGSGKTVRQVVKTNAPSKESLPHGTLGVFGRIKDLEQGRKRGFHPWGTYA